VVDAVLSGCSVLSETVLVVLLLRVNVFKIFPAFFLFACWNLVGDVLVNALQRLYPLASFRVYEVVMVIDSAMIFAVLVELAWSVLKPVRSSLPKNFWIGIAVLIGLAGLLLWPVAGLTVPDNLTSTGGVFFRLQQTFAILRVVVFLGMLAFSQLLAIGWRNRELQIAAGLGFYSILSLAISIVHTHQAVGSQYHWLDELGVVGYLSAVTYWVLAFATKEVERQEFSPQMTNFLLILGGTAKTSRVALRETVVTKTRYKDHQ
jgi:hypothetical protein